MPQMGPSPLSRTISPHVGPKSPLFSKYFQPPGSTTENSAIQEGFIHRSSLIPAPLSPLRTRKGSPETGNRVTKSQPNKPIIAINGVSRVSNLKALYDAPRLDLAPTTSNPPPNPSNVDRSGMGKPKDGIRQQHKRSLSRDDMHNTLSPTKIQASIGVNDDHAAPSSASTTPILLTHADIEGSDGYQLKAETYSPNTQAEFVRKEQLWSQMNHETPESLTEVRSLEIRSPEAKSPEAKSPKFKSPRTLHDRRNQVAQNLKFAPQLPPLFFESDTQMPRRDFAYHDPPRSAVPLGYRVAQEPAPSLKVSSAPLGRHPADHPPVPRLRHTQIKRPDIQETYANVGSDCSDGESYVRTPPRNSPTQHAVGPAGQGTTNSFYWHSPQSSSRSTETSSPMVTARDELVKKAGGDEVKAAKRALTSATALGFGGPSDWEHFGDYDGEEIDDIDLYVSSKPRTAELSAADSPNEETSATSFDVPKQFEQQPAPPLPQPGVLPDIPLLGEGDQLPSIEELSDPDAEENTTGKKESPRGTPFLDDPKAFPLGPNLAVSTEDLVAPPNSRAPPAKLGDKSEETVSAETSEMALLDGAMGKDEPTNTDQYGLRQIGSGIDDSAKASSALVENAQTPATAKANGIDLLDHHGKGPVSENCAAKASTEPPFQHQSPPRSKHSAVWSSGDSTNTSSLICSPPSTMKPKHIQRRITTDREAGEDIIISLEVPDSPPIDGSHTMDSMSDRLRDRSLTALPPPAGPAGPTAPSVRRVGRKSMFPQFVELENPYEHLDPWAKASLNRYVKMLRDEAQAETDEEKYMIFCSFTDRETRLRTVLYDMEEEDLDGEERTIRLPSGKKALFTSALRDGQMIKALPALPPLGKVFGLGQLGASIVESPTRQQSDEVFLSTKQESIPAQATEKAELKVFEIKASKASNDESFVMVDSPIALQDGLVEKMVPAMSLKKRPSIPTKTGSSMNSLRKALELVTSKTTKNNKQAAAADAAAMKGQPMERADGSGSHIGTPISAHDTNHSDHASPIEKSPYAAYKSGEGRPYEGDKAANRQTIYRPFSMLLRQTSQRQSAVDGTAASLEKSPSVRRLTVGSMTGPDGQPIPESLGIGLRPPSMVPNVPLIPPSYRYTILGPLLAVVPMTSDLRPEPMTVKDLRHQMEAVHDDFSFIHATVLAWDGEAKLIRERQERERNARQSEMDQRIDALFNEHEIGYADISELEADFKKKEAGIKAAEDHAEFQSFVARVFDEVWARLHYEMDQLIPLYDICTKLVAEASAGKEMFEDHDNDRVPIASAMEILLVLYQKLHVRHQKAFEAVLERDRRLKKSELALWFALDNLDKVKAINGRFEAVEKKAILEFCRQRDERANLLMDVLDQNTLRGVGSNQDYMEAVMQAVRRIAADVTTGPSDPNSTNISSSSTDPTATKTSSTSSPALAPSSSIFFSSVSSSTSGSNAPPHGAIAMDEIYKARAITAALARSSEQIVQTFHVADMILNAADYEVSVANAKLSNADAASFRRLREAKAKEDRKLVRDLEHRMALVRGDTARTQDEVARLLLLLEKVKERERESGKEREKETVKARKEGGGVL